MKRYLIALIIALGLASTACTSGGGAVVREPSVRVGINVSTYPRLSRIPGYPVYYAPGAGWNYFFYDDLYWVYDRDNWYSSSGYNGPWGLIDPFYVPSYVLRVPVRYYTRPPGYFRGWRADAPPRWDEHWGRDWSARRGDWNRWDPRSAPPAVPPRDYPRGSIDERDPGTRGLPRANQPRGSREQRGTQEDTRGRQLPQTERAPAPVEQQEPSQPQQRGPQGRGRQQIEPQGGRGGEGAGNDDRERRGKQIPEGNLRGR
jgi:hypothetical protein